LVPQRARRSQPPRAAHHREEARASQGSLSHDCTMRSVTLRRARLLLIAVAICGRAFLLSAQENSAAPAVTPRPMARTVRITSAALGNSEYAFAVLLPTGYDTSARRYPVL